jgi:hypothetical protein
MTSSPVMCQCALNGRVRQLRELFLRRLFFFQSPLDKFHDLGIASVDLAENGHPKSTRKSGDER